MPISPKNWQDSPSTATPINAAALEDLETRVTTYGDDSFVHQDGTGIPGSVATVSPFGGAPASTPTVWLDSYYDSASYANKSAAIQAAHDAAVAGRAVLECQANRVYLLDTAPLQLKPSSPIIIEGHGATFKAAWGKPRCIDFARTADYQTFNDIDIRDLTFDANNLTSTSGQSVVGNRIDGGGVNMQRVNMQRIYLRRCKWINVAVPAAASPGLSCVELASHHAAGGETQTSLTDIRVEQAWMRGGSSGVLVQGDCSASANVFHDRLYVEVDHDTDVVQNTPTRAGANVQIGGAGFGDYCEVHVQGANSADVGVEIDCMQTAHVWGGVTDARNAAYLARNFNTPIDPAAQRIVFHGTRAQIVNLTGQSVGAGYGLGSNPIGGYTTAAFGTVVLDNASSENRSTDNIGYTDIIVNGPLRRLVTKDIDIQWPSLAHTLTSSVAMVPIYIAPNAAADSTGANWPFVWENDGGRVRIAGTVTLSGHNCGFHGVEIQAPDSWDCTFQFGRPLRYDFEISGLNLSYHFLLQAAGPSVTPAKVRGELAINIEKWSDTGVSPYGVYLDTFQGDSPANINLDKRLVVRADCRALPSGSAGREVYSPTQANKLATWPYAILAPGLVPQGGTPSAPAAITPGGSPYTYQNFDGQTEDVIVSGGTVSVIERGNGNGTTYTTGLTAGSFRLEAGQVLKVTYSSAPTMTKILVA